MKNAFETFKNGKRSYQQFSVTGSNLAAGICSCTFHVFFPMIVLSSIHHCYNQLNQNLRIFLHHNEIIDM